jgi:hypothetical protein
LNGIIHKFLIDKTLGFFVIRLKHALEMCSPQLQHRAEVNNPLCDVSDAHQALETLIGQFISSQSTYL